MVLFKWIVYTPAQSKMAPSILIHFIDMFLFTENPQNKELYTGQVCVVCELLGKEHVVVLTHSTVILLKLFVFFEDHCVEYWCYFFFF